MNKKHSPQFIAIVNEAKKQIQETDVTTVHKMIKNNESFYLIDVREAREWKRGHLPKAIHLSKGMIECDIEKKIPDKEAKIILYCGGGFRSALSALNLKKMGYKNVISMDGGFRGWKAAGYEIKKKKWLRFFFR